MAMNLTKLFEMQRVLDERIEKEHPRVDGEDRLAKKILALQVELGECANEWRGFKFWSKDQVPRNYCKMCQAIETPHICKNPLLEEYVDCLHFILSIGLDLGYRPAAADFYLKSDSVNDQFIDLITLSGTLLWDRTKDTYYRSIEVFVGLGEMLGFTWEQIEQAYISKNEVNHERQNAGY